MALERFFDQPSPDPRTMVGRIDEQRFHVAAVEQHEADRAIGLVDGQIERRARQKCDDFGFDRATVVVAQEVMRGIDGVAPDIQHACAVGLGGLSNSDHGLTWGDPALGG